MEAYEMHEFLGEGTWGVVSAGRHKRDGRKVALKRIKPNQAFQGLNFTALREIKYLQEITHPNVVPLHDVFLFDGCMYLVFEFELTDLEKMIRDDSLFFLETHIKCLMHMLFSALKACHDNFILHRDLKPSNLLVSSDGVLKLGDFGLARYYGSCNDTMTSEVVTSWYRAPELFFGATCYGVGVDMWAAGCIFGEIMCRKPFFDGESNLVTQQKIFQLLGTPNEQTWPGVSSLSKYVEFEPREALDITPLVRTQSAEAKDLLLGQLTLNPTQRLTATQALAHPYFSAAPSICQPSEIPLPRGKGAPSSVGNVAPTAPEIRRARTKLEFI